MEDNQKIEINETETLFEDDSPCISSSGSKADEKPGICYCGQERNVGTIEFLCTSCNGWFHEFCLSSQFGKLVPFMFNYAFACRNCTSSGMESFRKTQPTIQQMCITAIANLQHNATKEGDLRRMFSKEKEVLPFIEQNWESITSLPRRFTQSWYTTVQRLMMKDVKVLFTYEENEEGGNFGLVNQDLDHIKPNYDTLGKQGVLRLIEDGPQASAKTGRQSKRKYGGDSGVGKKGRPTSDITANVKLPPHGYPLEHPFNKDGYRYILAEPDPHAPFRKEFDESPDWAGKPIPGWLYRTLTPHNCLLALHDRAPQLKVSEDRLTVTGEKGYCMIRATHYVNRGRWYFEAKIDDMPELSATRIGWVQMYGCLQAPCGYDKFGYSWRSRKGTRFHESHGRHYTDAYVQGDVLGFLIDLPEEKSVNYLPHTFKDRPLVKFKSHLYYEDKDKVQEAIKNLRVLPDSKIEFFKNGVSQGVAWTDIYAGCYYPSISIHKSASVRVNFGPNFAHPEVLSLRDAKGMNDRVEELVSEQALADMLYLTENEGKLRLDNV